MTYIDDLAIKTLALWLIPGLGPRKMSTLMHSFSSMAEIFSASTQTLIKIEGINHKIADQIKTALQSERLKNEIALVEKYNLKMVVYSSRQYPADLKEIYSPPPVVYYQGDINTHQGLAIAIVGARKASFSGKNFCKKLVQQLANYRKDIIIISGLALGIDTIAHQTALDCGLKTMAVLAGGLSSIYPASNRQLAYNIAKNGCLLTEFPVETKPATQHFPLRNRIISGLSKGVIVIEAGEKSGALITAKDAIEQNRELFAVPGPVDSSFFKGTNRLIQRGHAQLIMNGGDVLEELDSNFSRDPKSYHHAIPTDLSDDDKLVIEKLQSGELAQDRLSEITNIPIHRLLGILTNLELQGFITIKSGSIVQLLQF